MAAGKSKTILFLCTGNYYRSRFAEALFNARAARLGLPWRAASRGLALERGAANVGPMSTAAIATLAELGVRGAAECTRLPLALDLAYLEQADHVVALDRAEHLPLMLERFTAWAERIEFWQVEDVHAKPVAEALAAIVHEVDNLVARLLGGRASPVETAPPPAAAAAPVVKNAVVKVMRETKGRRGKGVTIVADVPLDEAGLLDLAARLKQQCGSGGTVKDGRIEIQGDQRDKLAAALQKLGYQVKFAGG